MKIPPVAAELFHADVQTGGRPWQCQRSLFATLRTSLQTAFMKTVTADCISVTPTPTPAHTMKAHTRKRLSFLTSAQGRGEWLTSRPSRFYPPPPGNTLVPMEREAGWTPGPVWTFWRREKSLPPLGIRSSDRPAPTTPSPLTYSDNDTTYKLRGFRRFSRRGAETIIWRQ